MLDDFLQVPERVAHDFRNNGHALIRSVLPAPFIAQYAGEIRRACSQQSSEKRKLDDRDTYGKAFLQIMNLWESNEAIRQFTFASRFANVAAQLLGVDKVRLYHDQALFKEPGGGPTPWHQDQYYWPLDTHNTITMWMPLVDVSVEMGMLTFATGSHKKGLIENLDISDESEWRLEEYVRQHEHTIFQPDFMKAGDATFHYGYTLHKAPGNSTGHMREVMTVIYFADGAKVTRPRNVHQEADRQRWLQGIEPGMTANSNLNPVLG